MNLYCESRLTDSWPVWIFTVSPIFTDRGSVTSHLLQSHVVYYTVVVTYTNVINYTIQYNLNGSNTDGSFTVDDSNSFFSPYKILLIAQENKYLGIFFLFYHLIVCCVYSLELPHRGNSNVYTQHTIIVLKIEKISLNYRYLLPELVPWLTLSGSNYPCLERISMVPKMFEPLRFDCNYTFFNHPIADSLRYRPRQEKKCLWA